MTNYKIKVLEIGYVPEVPGEFYFGDYANGTGPFLNPFSMTLLQGNGKNVLIDSGLDTDDPVKKEMINGAGLANAHSPREVLATIGLCPEDIDVIFLTHLHFDHAGGVGCYPNAHFYLQKGELEGWQGVRDNPKYTAIENFSIDMNDLDRLAKAETEGRLTLLDGDVDEVVPGISIRKIDFAHSFANQIAMINTDQGIYLHVGDCCCRPENLVGTPGFPHYAPNIRFCVGAPYNIVKGYDRILELANGDIDHILMTHDASRRERFPHHESRLGLEIFEIV